MESKVPVKIGEPVGPPIIYYEKIIENRKFSVKELKSLLNRIEKDLDALYEKIDDKVAMLFYYGTFQRADNSEYIGFMSRCIDLRYGRKAHFKEKYKETFKEVLEKTKNINCPLNIDIVIDGAGDSITNIVQAKDPRALP